jgi:hypothetical protein
MSKMERKEDLRIVRNTCVFADIFLSLKCFVFLWIFWVLLKLMAVLINKGFIYFAKVQNIFADRFFSYLCGADIMLFLE